MEGKSEKGFGWSADGQLQNILISFCGYQVSQRHFDSIYAYSKQQSSAIPATRACTILL